MPEAAHRLYERSFCLRRKVGFAMEDYPIILSPDAVNAVLNGVKIQHRLMVMPKRDAHRWLAGNILADPMTYSRPDVVAGQFGHRFISSRSNLFLRLEYGGKGQTLWVRESYRELGDGKYEYKADPHNDSHGWLPPFYMPKSASRLRLQIESVWVERLEYLTETDIEAEGFSSLTEYMKIWRRNYGDANNPLTWVFSIKKL